MTIRFMTGNALHQLPTLAAQSFQKCVTSPPYWGLRDYGIPDQLGLERTPDEYVAKLVAIMREVHRVLADDGTLWLNLGDSYANDSKWGGASGGKHVKRLHGPSDGMGRGKRVTGLKAKDLVGIPWMVAFALRADGWYLRSDIVWAKPNGMPESVKDRPTRAHEYVFLLSKSERYYYNWNAVRTPLAASSRARLAQSIDEQDGSARANGSSRSDRPMKAVKFGGEKRMGGSGGGLHRERERERERVQRRPDTLWQRMAAEREGTLTTARIFATSGGCPRSHSLASTSP